MCRVPTWHCRPCLGALAAACLLLCPLRDGTVRADTLRPAATAESGVEPRIAREISGGSDAVTVPEAAYQQTLRVLCTVYERELLLTMSPSVTLGSILTVLRQYGQEFPQAGTTWRSQLLPIIDSLERAHLREVKTYFAHQLRKQVEALATAGCP